jgi:hypothetical protein
MNLIASDELNPQKTRILPTPALLKPRTTAKLQNLFYSYRSNAVVITALDRGTGCELPSLATE